MDEIRSGGIRETHLEGEAVIEQRLAGDDYGAWQGGGTIRAGGGGGRTAERIFQ